MKIINEIKAEYRKSKIRTIFMGAIILMAILNFIKPSSTRGILSYIGISIANFTLLSIIVLLIYWFYWRKK